MKKQKELPAFVAENDPEYLGFMKKIQSGPNYTYNPYSLSDCRRYFSLMVEIYFRTLNDSHPKRILKYKYKNAILFKEFDMRIGNTLYEIKVCYGGKFSAVKQKAFRENREKVPFMPMYGYETDVIIIDFERGDRGGQIWTDNKYDCVVYNGQEVFENMVNSGLVTQDIYNLIQV